MVLKRTVLGGIKTVVWWFLKKPFLHMLMLWARPGDTAICPCCGSLGSVVKKANIAGDNVCSLENLAYN